MGHTKDTERDTGRTAKRPDWSERVDKRAKDGGQLESAVGGLHPAAI
jgi:hypothetical protein